MIAMFWIPKWPNNSSKNEELKFVTELEPLEGTSPVPSVSKPILCVWCRCFGCGSVPFCVVLLCFLLAKRKSGRKICGSSLFCLCLFGFALNCGTNVFHIACLLFSRFSHCWTEPQSEIGRKKLTHLVSVLYQSNGPDKTNLLI